MGVFPGEWEAREVVCPFLADCMAEAAGLPVERQQKRKRFHDLRRTTARDLSRAGDS